MKKLLKWAPIIFAGLVAVVQEVMAQKETDRIDELEKQVTELKKGA